MIIKHMHVHISGNNIWSTEGLTWCHFITPYFCTTQIVQCFSNKTAEGIDRNCQLTTFMMQTNKTK